jgi:hypothetical protein
MTGRVFSRESISRRPVNAARDDPIVAYVLDRFIGATSQSTATGGSMTLEAVDGGVNRSRASGHSADPALHLRYLIGSSSSPRDEPTSWISENIGYSDENRAGLNLVEETDGQPGRTTRGAELGRKVSLSAWLVGVSISGGQQSPAVGGVERFSARGSGCAVDRGCG